MRFEDALVNLIQGKRIRSVNWEENSFIEIKDNKILDEDGDETHLVINLNIDWELYEESQKGLYDVEKLKATAFAEMEEKLYSMNSEFDDRLKKIEEALYSWQIIASDTQAKLGLYENLSACQFNNLKEKFDLISTGQIENLKLTHYLEERIRLLEKK